MIIINKDEENVISMIAINIIFHFYIVQVGIVDPNLGSLVNTCYSCLP